MSLYPFDEWRVLVRIPAGEFGSKVDTWLDRCFATEELARAFAEHEGGQAYCQRWVAPGVEAEGRLL